MTIKRLFFGFEVVAPWEALPKGRTLEESDRHLTLAFLGEVNWEALKKLLDHLPKIPDHLGQAGRFSKCLFLPPKRPNVVAWQAEWLTRPSPVEDYYYKLNQFLNDNGYTIKQHTQFLPHVTLARRPFEINAWKKAFTPLPLYTKDFHLYESVGNLTYKPLWTHTIAAPFQEIEHTADIAFTIRGETLDQLLPNAALALSFSHPPFIDYLPSTKPSSLDEIIFLLNQMISRADMEIGCPLKAVSLNGALKKLNAIYEWVMIVDV